MGSILDATAATGLEIQDLQGDLRFAARQVHQRDVAVQMEGLRRLSRTFVDSPATILQELVNVAVELCGADSAGMSMEQENATEDNAYLWVATAGQYEPFLNATLPRSPSACGICLKRNAPQHFTVKQQFFDLLQVVAPEITDGLLLPWQTDDIRGTLWIVAHGRTEAFDRSDLGMMQLLADFAAMAVRQAGQQERMLKLAEASAGAAVANDLAHQINNPLQSLTNIVYLALHGQDEVEAKVLAQALSGHVERLSVLVNKLLSLPKDGK